MVDAVIANAIDLQFSSLQDFRSSEKMKVAFCKIVEKSIISGLSDHWNNESLKRLDALMKLLINFLNIPAMSSMLGVGMYYSAIGVSSEVKSSALSTGEKEVKDLLPNLKRLLAEGLSMFKESEQLIIQTG